MGHVVTNQAPPLVDYDLFAADPVLADAVAREGGSWATDLLHTFGARVGSGEVIEWGFAANEHEPVLQTHDRFGNRIDEVEFHPAWHHLMDLSISNGLHSLPFEMISSITFALNCLGFCSPSIHLMASSTFDFPQPLGPTIALRRMSKFIRVFS